MDALEITKGGPLSRMNLSQMRILVFNWAIPNLHLRTILTPHISNEEEWFEEIWEQHNARQWLGKVSDKGQEEGDSTS